MNIEVVIGKPLLDLDILGFDKNTCVFTEERNLAQILVDIKFFKSKSEVRKNRPDLLRTLDKLDMEEIRIGKKVLWLIVGE